MAFPDEGSSVSARFGNDPAEPARAAEAYGPIMLRRYVKGDGRALILYTHGESAGGGPAHGGDE
jgi:hypothetical protein